MMMMFKGYSMS